MLLFREGFLAMLLLLCVGLTNAQESVEIERHYEGVAKKFCQTRAPILDKCLDISQEECEGLMLDIYKECDNDTPEKQGGLINNESFQDCSEKNSCLTLGQRG